MPQIIDARGLSCPQPVLLAKNEIRKGSFPVEIVVDTTASCENVSRMAKSKGFSVTVEPQNNDFKITINKG